MPFLSIIVPVYNAEEYLKECIDSILVQTFTDYELILVDDGSTDSSGNICDEYRKSNAAVKVIHKENGGLVSARKSGAMLASGKYIGYVDADDKIDKDMYRRLCESAIKENAEIVICDVWQWSGEKTKPINQSLNGGVFEKEQLKEKICPHILYFEKYYRFGFLPAMWNKIYKSELLKKNQMLVDEQVRIGEDAACSYFCILEANKVVYLKDYYAYYYRLNENSMCRNWTNRNILSASILLDYMYERLLECGNKKYMEQYWYYYSYIFTNMLYEYGEAIRIKQITNNVKRDFHELLNSVSFQEFEKNYKKIKIPFYRRIVANSVMRDSIIDTNMWKLFVLLRAVVEKLK